MTTASSNSRVQAEGSVSPRFQTLPRTMVFDVPGSTTSFIWYQTSLSTAKGTSFEKLSSDAHDRIWSF